VDEGLFAWFFSIVNEAGEEIATIDRAWGGFGREVGVPGFGVGRVRSNLSEKIFTDTGQYTVDFQPVIKNGESRGTMRSLTIEERAVS
jgi:hypothetical protein